MKKILLIAVVSFLLFGCSSSNGKVIKCTRTKGDETQKLDLTVDSKDKVSYLKISIEKKIDSVIGEQLKKQSEQIQKAVANLSAIKFKFNINGDVYSLEEEIDMAEINANKDKYKDAGLNLDELSYYSSVDSLKGQGFECK